MKKVYLGLGGNIGNSLDVLRTALNLIEALDGVVDFQVSRFYNTTPVSLIAQRSFINAVCGFNTSMDLRQMLQKLQGIEKTLGKVSKPNNAPRVIDIDILFFGLELQESSDCQVPHPRWHERLFVLQPLSDLVKTLTIPEKEGVRQLDLIDYISSFSNPHHETVSVVPET